MTDTITPSKRSKLMSKVRSKDTKPEMIVRRMVFKLGFRYRLHQSDLPGKPDLVFRKLKKIIFVHGCFWHKHSLPSCRLSRLPKSKLNYWLQKLESNKIRDKKNRAKLTQAGWKILIIWECQLKRLDRVKLRTEKFLR
ncbi:endonuclease [Candidatus Nitromaritima sp. SCGC AAA799-C22]|nr:endonuclease [Candidatus Nitromaritima sp. SCGC AAA799-C22]